MYILMITSKENRAGIKLLLDFDSQCHYDQMNQRPNKRDSDRVSSNWLQSMCVHQLYNRKI